VGVARGCVAFVTDPSNEGRAYAILGYVYRLVGHSVLLKFVAFVGVWEVWLVPSLEDLVRFVAFSLFVTSC